MIGIAQHLIQREFRQRDVQSVDAWSEEQEEFHLSAEDQTLARIEGEADFARVRRAFTGVPRIYQRILEMRFLERLEVPQISRQLHISQEAVWMRLLRGKKLLRRAWSRADSKSKGAAL